MMEVDEIFRESLLPITPFKHVPFPDEYVISENVHPLIVVLVVEEEEEEPPSIVTIDLLTLAALDPSDLTFTDVNINDPCDI